MSVRAELIQTGITFMRLIMEFYGPEHGYEIWNAVINATDPKLKNEMLYAMLTENGADGTICLTPHNLPDGPNRVTMIKAIRQITGLGLKEAKELNDANLAGKSIYIKCSAIKSYAEALRLLRQGGFINI